MKKQLKLRPVRQKAPPDGAELDQELVYRSWPTIRDGVLCDHHREGDAARIRFTQFPEVDEAGAHYDTHQLARPVFGQPQAMWTRRLVPWSDICRYLREAEAIHAQAKAINGELLRATERQRAGFVVEAV